MTKLERKAALAVAAATAGVIVSGVSLIRKHARYLTQKAAATFDPQDEDEELTREALAAGENQTEEAGRIRQKKRLRIRQKKWLQMRQKKWLQKRRKQNDYHIKRWFKFRS